MVAKYPIKRKDDLVIKTQQQEANFTSGFATDFWLNSVFLWSSSENRDNVASTLLPQGFYQMLINNSDQALKYYDENIL